VLSAIAIFVVTYFAGMFAHYIPFSYEQKMVNNIDYFQPKESTEQQRLQALADRLSKHMELPDDMIITLHTDESETVNAFATLGGHVVFFKGLLDKIESEQELAAVMAHEIAHVKLRHPIVATGKGITLATLASVVSGFSASSAGDWLIGSTINASMMSFSRAQESDADEWAARALQKEYGSIYGAKELFERFEALESQSAMNNFQVEVFRSHPYSRDRWPALERLAESENWNTQKNDLSQ